MIKKIPLVIPKKQTYREQYYCDVCGKIMTIKYRSGYYCIVCKRHLCPKCTCSDPTDTDCGDYPSSTCKKCYDMYITKYGPLINKLNEEIEVLENDWYKKGREKYGILENGSHGSESEG